MVFLLMFSKFLFILEMLSLLFTLPTQSMCKVKIRKTNLKNEYIVKKQRIIFFGFICIFSYFKPKAEVKKKIKTH